MGNTACDWNEFQKKTEYKGEYHANHPVMYVNECQSSISLTCFSFFSQWFWQVFHKVDEKNKKQFLRKLNQLIKAICSERIICSVSHRFRSCPCFRLESNIGKY